MDLEKFWKEPEPTGPDPLQFPDKADNTRTDLEKIRKESKPAKPDPSQFPDGGLEAWLVTLGCWCVFFGKSIPILNRRA